MKKQLTKAVIPGLLAAFCLGLWTQPALAAPIITNMPHKADGTRITGSQPVPKGMPGDVVVKTRTENAGQAGSTKPAATATQAAPKTEAAKPAATATQAAPKTEAAKPAATATQAAPKTEPAKPAATATQAAPKPTPAKPAAASVTLPTKPPGWETKKREREKEKEAKQDKSAAKTKRAEPVKSVYQVGDKGWKVKQAQQYLQKLGFEPVDMDGRFTKATRKAIRKFQKQYKLKETGNLDNATYDELKWRAEAKDSGGTVASAKILKTAAQYKGVRYVFGGTTPSGFDCSGYVQYVFAKNGVRLTRTADTQALEGKYVSRKMLKPGDLVFFTTYEPGASHVGIYAGNNKFWNASSSKGITLSDLTDSYWGPRYYTARRILAEK